MKLHHIETKIPRRAKELIIPEIEVLPNSGFDYLRDVPPKLRKKIEDYAKKMRIDLLSNFEISYLPWMRAFSLLTKNPIREVLLNDERKQYLPMIDFAHQQGRRSRSFDANAVKWILINPDNRQALQDLIDSEKPFFIPEKLLLSEFPSPAPGDLLAQGCFDGTILFPEEKPVFLSLASTWVPEILKLRRLVRDCYLEKFPFTHEELIFEYFPIELLRDAMYVRLAAPQFTEWINNFIQPNVEKVIASIPDKDQAEFFEDWEDEPKEKFIQIIAYLSLLFAYRVEINQRGEIFVQMNGPSRLSLKPDLPTRGVY